MVIVKMQKHNKNKLKESDKSYNQCVMDLINDYGELMPVYDDIESVVSTVRLNEDTLKLLDEYKIISSESYESVIVRLLYLSDKFK